METAGGILTSALAPLQQVEGPEWHKAALEARIPVGREFSQHTN